MASQTFYVPTGQSREAVIERVGRLLQRLPVDQQYEVEVRAHKPKRTTSQNAYLWGVVYPHILKAGTQHLAGWEAKDLHEYLLGEHFGWERVEGFGKPRMRPLRRSGRLNKQEFSDFVDFIKRRMAEHGITVPDAGAEMDDAA